LPLASQDKTAGPHIVGTTAAPPESGKTAADVFGSTGRLAAESGLPASEVDRFLNRIKVAGWFSGARKPPSTATTVPVA
jgi:hypothetical protein